jgi:hypothetical protein
MKWHIFGKAVPQYVQCSIYREMALLCGILS